jgi:hypothetical protein
VTLAGPQHAGASASLGGRATAHRALSHALERLSDVQLRHLIGAATPGATGIGGASRRVTVAGRPVFVRRHSPVALLMREFALKLRHESKLTPYPAARLASLLRP